MHCVLKQHVLFQENTLTSSIPEPRWKMRHFPSSYSHQGKSWSRKLNSGDKKEFGACRSLTTWQHDKKTCNILCHFLPSRLNCNYQLEWIGGGAAGLWECTIYRPTVQNVYSKEQTHWRKYSYPTLPIFHLYIHLNTVSSSILIGIDPKSHTINWIRNLMHWSHGQIESTNFRA